MPAAETTAALLLGDEHGKFYNESRAHQALDQAAPLRATPEPITEPARIIDLNIRRHDRLGG
ncbi:hypothetical protein [Nonomuraea sp. NPDC050310]|uniref:hypothetical protein n=1 Tax=Nonomuraea sp. NPDC050310 TaxID=3154935 RepID=UPI0033CAFA46